MLRWQVGLLHRASIRRFLDSLVSDAPSWACRVSWTEDKALLASTFTVSVSGAPADVARLLVRVEACANA